MPGRNTLGPRRSTGSSSSTARRPRRRRQELGERKPGIERSVGGPSAQPPLDRGGGLLEPRLRERPAVGDAHRVEPLLELGTAQQRARRERLDLDGLVDERPHDRGRVALAEQPVPLGVDSPRRGGVEHDCAPDRRLAAEDDAVAPRGDDRRGEPQLCMPVVARGRRERGSGSSRGAR